MQKIKDIKENEIATLAFGKFAMTERNEEKQKEIQKIDSRFHGNDIKRAGMTDGCGNYAKNVPG